VQINDYIESINQFTAGKFDACAITNMDTLTIPAAGGVDSTVVIVNDFSNGNDGLVLKGKGKTLQDVKGQKVNLVELSVSHYLLARALESAGLSERDITTVNTSDADIVAAYATPEVTAVATWNPQLATLVAAPDASLVFNSSQIPGEIMDLLVARTEVVRAHPELAKALTGAWYEVMGIMRRDDAQGRAARTAMATAAGTDLAGYDGQLKTTRLFYAPAEAAAFAESPEAVKTMDLVRRFSFAHGLLGEGARSADAVGIEFPGGRTLGDTRNIKLRFTSEFARLAADGKL
jgi:NitT/TauT family transport system substrate-binding protein